MQDINYEELVGKELDVVGRDFKLIVQDIDPECGITLIDAKTKQRRLCLIHPKLLRGKIKQAPIGSIKDFEAEFRCIAEQIQGGSYDFNVEAWEGNDVGSMGGIPSDFCAFS